MFGRYEMKLIYPSPMSLEQATEKAIGLLDFKVGNWHPTSMVGVGGMIEAKVDVELEQDAMRNRSELYVQDRVEVDGDFEILVEMK